jgi:hypothetical protein
VGDGRSECSLQGQMGEGGECEGHGIVREEKGQGEVERQESL